MTGVACAATTSGAFRTEGSGARHVVATWRARGFDGACAARRTGSEVFLDIPEGVIGLDVVATLLALGEFDLFLRQLLVRHVVEDVADDVEAAAPLVVGTRDKPRRRFGVG